jgi:hypothetical protein
MMAGVPVVYMALYVILLSTRYAVVQVGYFVLYRFRLYYITSLYLVALPS